MIRSSAGKSKKPISLGRCLVVFIPLIAWLGSCKNRVYKWSTNEAQKLVDTQMKGESSRRGTTMKKGDGIHMLLSPYLGRQTLKPLVCQVQRHGVLTSPSS